MTAQIEPGLWVRWLATDNPDAPLAQWRLLTSVEEVGWPRWMVQLTFADGFQAPSHRDNLTLVDGHGHRLWETATEKPAEVA